jgi:hypothetical protein
VRGPRFLCLRFLILLALLVTAGVPAPAQSQVEEYHIKAGFLYFFAQLVDWPSGDTSQPFTLCTIGDDPFEGQLDRTLAGKAVGSRNIRIRHLRDVKTLSSCQIVFIGKSEDQQTPTILAELTAVPTLTVGDSDNFPQEGGMIGFFFDGDKIRFNINLDPAEKSDLKISSRLLASAKEVVGHRGGK